MNNRDIVAMSKTLLFKKNSYCFVYWFYLYLNIKLTVMSFGGAVSAMVTSLKNNRRDRKSAFKKLKDNPAEYGEEGKLHFENEATPDQLKKIREDLRRENRKVMIRNVSIIVVIMLVLIYLIGFAKL